MRRRRKRETVADNRWHRRAFLNPRVEHLEHRYVLDSAWGTLAVAPAWFDEVAASYGSEPPRMMAAASPDFVGPMPLDVRPVSRWIVQLTPEAIESADRVEGAIVLLPSVEADLRVIRGLGSPGQLLVEAKGSEDAIANAFSQNLNVAYYELDITVRAQRMPNDPEFVAGSMVGLNNTGQFGGTANADIDAPEVWDETIGSTDVVVGVIDSGVDATHPDLYLNIWINQGEIPAALAASLTDVDGDGRITFYDLNNCAVVGGVSDPGDCDWANGPNAALLTDFQRDGGQANGYIDAIDLLEDPRWADGRDTDVNGFIDDFFGWNFRSSNDEPFAPNNPSDVLGHGTHVSGTIGAIGNNGLGVTGVNWQTSIMALKFLDQNNQGRISDAIAALNYATMMRNNFGVNIPVTNNSWGQAGGYSASLEAAIRAAGDAGILFVAAAGNGNILGRGVDNDRTPFYPASYDLDNVIAVAASDANDQLAQFSNFGATSVDIAAPGVGILSTLPGGRFGTANGTSMATPHVAGTVALIYSALPEASLSEVREAVLTGANAANAFQGRVATNGRLNAGDALGFDGFSPTVAVLSGEDTTVSGGTSHEIEVQYFDRSGINLATIGDGDLLVSRQWGPRDQISATLVQGSVVESQNGTVVTATYQVAAPGGSWDFLDFGEYRISIVADEVVSSNGQLSVPPRNVGAFHVRISDLSAFYVDTFGDSLDANIGDGACSDANGRCSLRAGIQEANEMGDRTIILQSGSYALSLVGTGEDASESGDLDVLGNVKILGNDRFSTYIEGAAVDRVFDLQSTGDLTLERVTVSGGLADYGGGIRSQGMLTIKASDVKNNSAAVGGGLEIPFGTAFVVDSNIVKNVAAGNGRRGEGFGGGLAVGDADVSVTGSAIAHNTAAHGGGVFTFSDDADAGKILGLSNVTISNNTANGEFSSFGSGLFIGNNASLDFVTITANSSRNSNAGFATYRQGAVLPGPSSPFDVLVSNSIVVGNGALDAARYSISDNWRHYDASTAAAIPEIVSQGFNLVGNVPSSMSAFGASGDQIDPFGHLLLGPLKDNGGPSLTHALLHGSSAHDAANPNSDIAADQRGLPRTSDADGDAIAEPDIGAFESHFAEVRGLIIDDLDGDGRRDLDEPGLANRMVFVDINENGEHDANEPAVRTAADNPDTVQVVETGMFSIKSVLPGTYLLTPLVEQGWKATESVADGLSVGLDGRLAGGVFPKISSSGRFVAFHSDAPNLVSGDTNLSEDVFVYDRDTSLIERVSISSDGTEGNSHSSYPSISSDGRYVAFTTLATNWGSGVTNGRNRSSSRRNTGLWLFVYAATHHGSGLSSSR